MTGPMVEKMKTTAAFELLGHLSTYLSSPPRTLRIVGEGFGLGWDYRQLLSDIITIKTPAGGAIYEKAKITTQKLDEECSIITGIICNLSRPMASSRERRNTRAHGRIQAQRNTQARGDMRSDTYGVEKLDDSCTFVFLMRWTTPERMAMFKDPHQPSMASMQTRLSPDWWEATVIQPLAELSSLGAAVTFRTIDFHPTKQKWPFEKLEQPLLDTKAPLGEEMNVKGCFGTKHLKRSCTIM
jgi:hypothetical protein